MEKKHKHVAVGFYTDTDGKTKPITKSTGELHRKKIVQNPRQFKGVKPHHKRVAVKPMVKQFYDVISYPVKNCATWYTYYYLTEFAKELPPIYRNIVKGAFNRQSEQLETAFLNYGTYSILRELRHITGEADWIHVPRDAEFRISLYPTPEAFTDERKARKLFVEVARKNRLTRKESDLVWIFLKDYHGARELRYVRKSKDSVTRFMKALQRMGLDFTRRQEIFEVAEGLFRKLAWNSSYGGRVWERIARTMGQHEKVTRTIWLDMMWALQHNSGTWINKVELKDSDWKLRETLDAKREGNLRYVGRVAAKYNPRLETFLKFLPRKPKRL